MANSAYVTQGKPKIGGAISVAPKGTAVPTDAKSSLASTFKQLGYVSSDGLTNGNSMETSDVNAWGGDKVLTTDTSKTDTFQFSLMEVLNVDVLKFVYGESNVSGTLETGITIKSNSNPLEEHVIVVDMIMKGGYLKRIVVPNGKITTIDDIVYKDDEATVLPITVSATADEEGQTHYEYISAPAASAKTASEEGKE